MTLEKALQILIGNQEDKKAESFLKFLSDKYYGTNIKNTLWTR